MKRFLLAALAATLLAGTAQASTVTLTWTPPATRTDGSALAAAQIAGADIWDTAACPAPCPDPKGAMIGSVTGALGTFMTGQLTAGAHTFRVITRDTSTPSLSSAPSNAVTATIVVAVPATITNLTFTIGP